MTSKLSKLVGSCALVLALTGPGMAQVRGLPEQLFNTTRPSQGESIRFCLDERSVGYPFDKAVAVAIADSLLLQPVFVAAPTGFGLDAEGFADELQLALTNSCDAMLGMSLQPDSPLSDWATFTRAYAEIPFVFAVVDPSYKSLGDIPKDKALGTALGSVAESAFIVYSMAQPEDQRWRRWPYADYKLMLKRLLDGTIGGMLLWEPAMNELLKDDPNASRVKIVSTDPMPVTNVSVGIVVSSRDTFIRSQLDEAIGALNSDGTIQAILDEQGIIGTPGTN